jgi:phi LC3 family holin
MKINWKVRIRNKNFWLTVIPAVLLVVQPVLALCGVTIDATTIGAKLLAIVDAVFVLLAVLGVVTDPTTHGMSDSEQAMTYLTPKK